MTVGTLLSTISSRELTEWQALLMLEAEEIETAKIDNECRNAFGRKRA